MTKKRHRKHYATYRADQGNYVYTTTTRTKIGTEHRVYRGDIVIDTPCTGNREGSMWIKTHKDDSVDLVNLSTSYVLFDPENYNEPYNMSYFFYIPKKVSRLFEKGYFDDKHGYEIDPNHDPELYEEGLQYISGMYDIDDPRKVIVWHDDNGIFFAPGSIPWD